ncbi:MAG: alpha/beta fold hydrolase [Pseudomonadota bacterium]
MPNDRRHVVFLPGFLCDQRLFSSQREALFAQGIQSSVADLTGAASIERLAAQVLRAAPDRFALVGLSMGGIVAMEIMRRAPERVSHLGLLNTTPLADRSGAVRVRQMRRVIEGGFEDVLREELKPQYLAETNRTAERLELLLSMGRRLGPDVFRTQTVALMGREAYTEHIKAIQCPTLVLTGALDSVCPPHLHREMAAKIPNAALKIVARCGHLSVLEQADAVSAHLISLLLQEHDALDEPPKIVGSLP